MDAGAGRIGERLGSGVEILAHCAGERGDGRAGDGAGDRADTLEIPRRRAREARLDDVDAEPLQLRRDRRFFMRLQRDAGRLLAVAQRRIEYLDPAGHEHVLS